MSFDFFECQGQLAIANRVRVAHVLTIEVKAADIKLCLVMSFSIIIPAFNEADTLPATLEALQHANAQIIVVDNNSTDNTADVAREHGATVVFEAHNQISKARNTGGRAASGDYLVFVDADTHVPPETLAKAYRLMQEQHITAGGALIVFDREVFWLARWTIGLWNCYSRRRREAAGCFLFCTREAFDAVGGFSERVYASEEIWFVRAIKRWLKAQSGYDKSREHVVIIEEPRVVTSARKADQPVRTALTMLLLLVFPPAIYYRTLLGFWYRK